METVPAPSTSYCVESNGTANVYLCNVNVPLVAGNYYVIGAFVSGGTFTSFSPLAFNAIRMSFGQNLSGASIPAGAPATVTNPMSTASLWTQQLTTTL